EPLAKHVWMVNGGRARKQGETPRVGPAVPAAAASVPTPVATSAAPVTPVVAPRTAIATVMKAASHVRPPTTPQTNRIATSRDGVMSDTPNPSAHYPVNAGSEDVLR